MNEEDLLYSPIDFSRLRIKNRHATSGIQLSNRTHFPGFVNHHTEDTLDIVDDEEIKPGD